MQAALAAPLPVRAHPGTAAASPRHRRGPIVVAHDTSPLHVRQNKQLYRDEVRPKPCILLYPCLRAMHGCSGAVHTGCTTDCLLRMPGPSRTTMPRSRALSGRSGRRECGERRHVRRHVRRAPGPCSRAAWHARAVRLLQLVKPRQPAAVLCCAGLQQDERSSPFGSPPPLSWTRRPSSLRSRLSFSAPGGP